MSAPLTTPELGFVHRFAPGTDGRTMLLLHGTGGDERDLLELGRAMAPASNLLSPRGKVLEHGMPRFFRRLAEGVFDVPDLIARTRELAAFVRAAAKTYRFDAEQVTAVGFSNGANIAASLLLLEPAVLSAAVLLRPMVPLVPERTPELRGKRVLIAAGTGDPYNAGDQAGQLAALLRAGGAEVTLEVRPAGHGLVEADIARAWSWLSGA